MHATIPRLPRREMKFLQLSYLSSDVFCSQFLIVPSLATSKPQTTRATHKSTIIFLPPVVSWYFLSATDRGKIFTSYQTNSHKQHQPASTSLSLSLSGGGKPHSNIRISSAIFIFDTRPSISSPLRIRTPFHCCRCHGGGVVPSYLDVGKNASTLPKRSNQQEESESMAENLPTGASYITVMTAEIGSIHIQPSLSLSNLYTL